MTEDYKIVKFGDVAKKINKSVNRETTTLYKYVAGQHIKTDDLTIKKCGIRGDNYLGPAFNKEFKKGQILHLSRNPHLRKVAIPDFDGICANTTFVIEPTGKGLLPELVPFVMHSQAFTDHSIRESKGSTNPYINWKDIAKYEFPVPADMERQKEILEVLLSAENCLLSLSSYIELCQQYKRICLKKYFHPCERKAKLKRLDPFIGKDRLVHNLQEIADIKGRIGWKGLKASEYNNNGPYLIANKHILNNEIQWEICDHISKYRYDESPEIMLKINDIVISKDGTLGTIAFIMSLPNEATINSTMMLIRIKKLDKISPEYIYYYLQSDSFKKYLKILTAGSTVPHLYQEDMKQLNLVTPELKEQRKISELLAKIDICIKEGLKENNSNYNLKFRLINEYFPSKEEVQA